MVNSIVIVVVVVVVVIIVVVIVVLVVVAFNLGKYPVHLYLIGQQRAGHQMQAIANTKAVVELVAMSNQKQIQMEKEHNRQCKYQTSGACYNVKCQHSIYKFTKNTNNTNTSANLDIKPNRKQVLDGEDFWWKM